MSLSERQLQLIQGGVESLMHALTLTREEAVTLVVKGIRSESAARAITLEALEIRPRAERAAFIRGVVHHVQQELESMKTWPSNRIERAVREFIAILHESWMAEGKQG